MPDAAMWREKATALRERARNMERWEEAETLLALAEDCEQLAADSEEKKAG
jgi:hypothetical protein